MRGNLVIEEVVMKNVLSHRDTRVEIPLGVTVIVGPNGAGKTSIIDAISYALFSIHSRHPRRKDPLIRLGSHTAYIELTFRVGGKRYKVVKRIQRGSGGSDARLYRVEDGNMKVVAVGVASVKAELVKLTGIGPDVARYTVIARQGELDILLTDKSKRVEAIDALLGLKNIEKAYENMRLLIAQYRLKLDVVRESVNEKEALLSKLREQVREKQSIIERLEEVKSREAEIEEEAARVRELISRYERLRDDYLRLKAIMDNLEADLARKMAERRRIASELEKLRSNISSYSRYEGLLDMIDELREAAKLAQDLGKRVVELERNKSVLKELRDAEEKARELDELQRRYSELIDELDKLSSKVKEYTRKSGMLRSLEEEREDIDRHVRRIKRNMLRKLTSIGHGIGAYLSVEVDPERLLEMLRHNFSESDNRVKRLESELEKKKARLSAVKERIKSIEDSLEKLTMASGRCPLCRRPLTEQHRLDLIRELKREKRELEAEASRLEADILRLERLLEEEKARRDELLRDISNLTSTIEQLRMYERRLREIDDKINRLREELLTLRLSNQRFKEIQAEKDKLSTRIRELEPFKKRIDELKYARRRVAELEEEIASIESRLKSMLARFSEACGGCRITLDEIGDVVKVVEELKEMLSRLEYMEERVDELDKEIGGLRERLREVSDKIKEINYDEEAHEKLKERLEELEHELRSLADEKGRLMERLKNIEEAEEQAKAVESELERLKRVASKLERVINDLTKIRNALRRDGLPQLIRRRMKELIADYMREILAGFNLGFTSVEVDDDFGVEVRTPDGPKTVNMLSGGERIALALALRLAIARALGSRMGILILDEPTVYLDEERRRDLIDILKSSSRALGVAQILIVTHDRELEDAADTVIEVRRENGVSRAVIMQPDMRSLVSSL